MSGVEASRTCTRDNDDYAWNGGVDVDRSYTVNGLNQYTAAGGTTFAYDANGNLTRSGATNYVYDVENRLVSASGGHTANLRYDPLGRLYEVGGATPSRRFLWDGDALAAEYTAADTLAARFVHGTATGVDDPLVWYGGGENRRLHADHLGSIIAVTYGNGEIRWINGYDEWGIPNDPNNTGRFQYTGQLWIGELGMYHYKARLYSPTLGRFLQIDPIGYEGGINLYGYAQNDPVGRLDPTGLVDIYIGGGGDDWLHNSVENYARRAGGAYYNWTEAGAIIRQMRQAAARGEPITVTGHSYGGASALNVIHLANVQVDLLITIDPVGGLLAPGAAGRNARHWVNVTADPENRNLSDFVGWLGGKLPRRVTDRANERLTSSRHHREFTNMMNEIQAARRINQANRLHRERQRRRNRTINGGSGSECPELQPGSQCGRDVDIQN